jgi:uncharacterized protein YjiS (DUF1127 family)
MSRARLGHLITRGHLAPGAPALARLHAALVIDLPARIELWLARSRQRLVLTELAEEQDDHLLRDIGVCRDAARREAARWFWS